MVDRPDSHNYREPHEESPAPGELKEGGDAAGDPRQPSSLEPGDVEVESLKKKLVLYETGLDAVHEQIAAMQRESRVLAESVRSEAEAKAREIIRRATVEAELLELKARVHAEEMRAREVARLWAHSDWAVDVAAADQDTAALDQNAPAPPHDGERQAIDSGAMAEPSQGDDLQTASGDERGTAEETGEAETSDGTVEGHPSDGQVADTQPEPDLTLRAREEDASDPDVAAQPSQMGILRYRVKAPLTSVSMAAIEQSVGRISGVLSAKVSPSQDGGGILTVSADDPRSIEAAIRKFRM